MDTTPEMSEFQFVMNVEFPENLKNDQAFTSSFSRYMDDMAREARDYWLAEAGRRLKSSRKAYQDSIMLFPGNGLTFVLILDHPLAVAVEAGADSFDMKPGLVGKTVPLNVNHDLPPTPNPRFRAVGPNSQGWIHPGWEGMNIIDDVVNELTEVIIPKYIEMIIEEMFI